MDEFIELTRDDKRTILINRKNILTIEKSRYQIGIVDVTLINDCTIMVRDEYETLKLILEGKIGNACK